MAKNYTTDAFGPYTSIGESISSRYPILPPGEKACIVAASTKLDLVNDSVITLLSGSMAEVIEKIGDEEEAPDFFYAARAFYANGGRYLDAVIPTSAAEHLTVAEAITEDVKAAVEDSDASLLIVPKPDSWTLDGYGGDDCQNVDKTFIDLVATFKHGRMFYIMALPQNLTVEEAIDYVTNAITGVNKQSRLAKVVYPNAYISNVDGTESVRDVAASVAGLSAKLAREHPRGVAKSVAGSKDKYHLAGLNRLELNLFNRSDTVKASLQAALINPLFSNNGIYLFGDSSLLPDDEDVFRHFNISRQFSEIQQQVALISDDIIFENTDSFTLTQLKGKVEAYMDSLVELQKIKQYFVNVEINSVNSSQVDVTVGVSPEYPIEYIVFTITADTSAE